MGRIRDSYILPLLAIFSALPLGLTLDCGRLQNEGKSWDLRPLDGAHTVSHSVSHGPTVHNTTYTLDICKPLKGSECRKGTYVCGDVTIIPEEGPSVSDGYIQIAGNYINYNGRTLDSAVKRLKGGEIHREGVRLKLHGGKHPFEEKKGENQQAVIDFICDRDRTGLEGQDKEEKDPAKHQDDDGDDGGGNGSEVTKSLRFKSYGHEGEAASDVLRLEWLTKYACADYTRSDDGGSSWGFFTWLIVLLFLSVAAYLIFGSWMNYNRYGARGWDMLPHSDTIRDVPYLLKDWGKRVVTTIQGPGSRGGYSAV